MPLTKPVSSIMTTSPVVANEFTTFSQVLRLFNEFPVHHLPIVDDNNKLIGMVSSNDFIKVFKMAFAAEEAFQMTAIGLDQKVRIKEIMTPEPVTISSTASIGEALKVFAEKRFLALPVVDNGQLVGILSAKDVIGYLA
jgi:CBS domain-containing protein